MTPLGHTAISGLVGVGLTRIFPNIGQKLIISATIIGGIILDSDLLYRFHQKGKRVFDGTIGQHRFFLTHTPIFSLFLASLISFINFQWAIFFFIGCLIHLFIDTLFFPEGINFFYPFGKKMTKILTITTHKFWAPKPISQVTGWWKNYLTSPLFWFFEIIPTISSIVIGLDSLK